MRCCHIPILHERLPHDVVYPLGARQLRFQPRNLVLELRRATIQLRSGKKRIGLVPRSSSGTSMRMCRFRRLDEEFPVVEKLLARIRCDGIVRRGLS